MINLDYKSGATLHEQIEGGIKQLIISGALRADEQLPSVRELSVSLTVNPNTVQRAYKQLEQDGFIYSIKGKGSFVAPAAHDADGRLRRDALEAFSAAARELAFLGADKAALVDIIDRAYREKEDSE